MNADLSSHATLLQLQGDLVLVYYKGQQLLLTFVHVVDVLGHSLRLVNKQERSRKPDWPVHQEMIDAIEPAAANKQGAKWVVEVY